MFDLCYRDNDGNNFQQKKNDDIFLTVTQIEA